MFGAERLEALLTAGGPMSPEDVLLRVEQAVEDVPRRRASRSTTRR